MADQIADNKAGKSIAGEGLARRLRALESAVALERKLRRRQQELLDMFRKRQTAAVLQGALPVPDDDVTNPLPPRPAHGQPGQSSMLAPGPQRRPVPLIRKEAGGERPLALPAGFELNEYRIDNRRVCFRVADDLRQAQKPCFRKCVHCGSSSSKLGC